MSIELDDVASGYNISKINKNFQTVENYINDKLMARADTGVAGESKMERDLDMDGHVILNADIDGSSITNDRAIRVPSSEPHLEPLPLAEARKGTVLGFNALTGLPETVIPVSGSAADVLFQLQSPLNGKGDELVTVKQPATIGVARTQHSKNLDIINIKDVGAVCDGVTDDTAVLNSIIQSANGGMVRLDFPYASTVKIAGTVLVPGGVSINLNHSIINGNGNASTAGTNTVFESAYWDPNDNTLKSNWSVPPEQVGITGLVPDLRIYGGRIRFAATAFKLYQMIYGSSITDMRITACGFPMIIKDSFYGTFDNIAVLTPPASVAGSIGWQVTSNIQAMGIRKCVSAGFNTGWKITGSSATDCFDTCTAENCVRGVDIYGGASGIIMNLELQNWYFERNTIAVRVDGAAVCKRLYLKNCYLHWNTLHIDGSTILSGGLDKSCNIQDSAEFPGGINMPGRSGELTFPIELEDVASTSHTSSTLPANYSVTGSEVKRVETLQNSTGGVIARNLRQTSTPPKTYTGQSINTTLPNNTVPFCSVDLSDPTRIVITTQVIRSAFNIVHINILINDNGNQVNACGTLFGSFNFLQPAGVRAATITYDGSNRMLIAIAGTSITNVQGLVRVI